MKCHLPLATGLLALFLFVLGVPAEPMAQSVTDTLSQNQKGSGFQTVITGKEIRESGITRLHELFTLMDHWSGYSVNGQDFHAAVTGLSPIEGAGWTLLIDEQKVEVQILNWQQLNLAPVSLHQIEKVIVIHSPQIYQGHFTDRGLIHIITGRNHEGWIAEGRIMAGNEIHDPGPFEFTEIRTPNEERVGPDADLLLGYRRDGWFLHGSYSALVHRTTDTPVERRIKDMLFTGPPEPLFETPKASRKAVYVRGGHHGDAGSFSLQAGQTHQRDILFLRPYGRDLPVEFQNRLLGAAGTVPLGEQSTLLLKSAWQEWNPGYAPNRENLDLRFQAARWSHQFGWRRTAARRQVEIGTRLESTRATGAFQQGQIHESIWHYYHQWHEFIHSSLQTTWDFQFSSDRNSRAVKSTFAALWQLKQNQRLHSSLSFSERLAAESQGLWFWAANGYTTLSDLEISYDSIQEIRSSSLLSASLEWQMETSETLSVQLGGYLRHHRGVLLSEQKYQIVRPHQWFEHNGVTLYPDGEATTTGIHARIQLKTGESLSYMLFIGGHRVLSGTAPMRSVLENIPAERLRITTSWKPVNGFELWSGLQAQSSAAWSDFEKADGESYRDQQGLVEGRYQMKTGPRSNLEVGGRKSLWENRLRLSLFIKNLLNRPHVEYPIGAGNDLTFYIQLELNL
ncbi:MAG: hypothetical protein WD355_01605 [Balneolaceae bacterium]